MYKQGVLYIWQNQKGEYAYLNGTETTVLSGPNKPIGVGMPTWRETDSLMQGKPDLHKWYLVAFPGDLREKNTPNGERKIMEMFTKTITKTPVLEPA